MHKSRFSQLILLTGILLFAAFVRVLHLDAQSIWVDEGYAYYHANYPGLIESLARDTHPPLYFASLRLWEEVAGKTTFALRYFSLLPSVLSVAVMVLLSKEFLRLRKEEVAGSVVPVLAALLLALTDSEIFLSQEIRHYTWHVLLAICSMWAFLRWQRTGKRGIFILWIVFTAALAYTHYVGTFTAVAQGLYALVFLRGKGRLQALGGLIAAALLLAPWLLLVGVHQLGNNGVGWSVELDAGVAQDILIRYFSQQWPLMVGLALLGLVTLIYNGHTSVRWRPIGPKVLPLLWLLVPIVLIILINLILPFLQPRRLSQIAPAIAMLVAFGLANVRPPIRGFLVAVIFVYGVTHVDFYRMKPPWEAVSRVGTQYIAVGDLSLTDIEGGDYQLQYYYSQMLPEGVDYGSMKSQRDFFPDTYESWLPAQIDAHDTVWLMHWHALDRSAFAWFDTLGYVNTVQIITKHDAGTNGIIDLTTYRYDRLNDKPLAQYDNGMSLYAARLFPDQLRVDLIWSFDEVRDIGYTSSVKLLDAAGMPVAQMDSPPVRREQIGTNPEIWWVAEGDTVYDPKVMQLTTGADSLPAGDYTVIVQVYRSADVGEVRTLEGAPWYIAGQFTLPQ